MAETISNFNITSALLLLLLLLLPHPNLCHTALEESQCRFLDTDMSNNFVKGGDGVGIPFMKSSCGRCGNRRTSISPKRVNPLVVTVASVALFGITVAVFAYLFLKSINVSELLHMMSIGRHMSRLVYSLDGFGEYDGIMSRRRIRASRNHEVKAC